MKFFLKLIVIIFLFVVPTYAQIQEHYIIFGDSLSDTGNFPVPATIDSPSIDNFNLYVPITNPVPRDMYGKNHIPNNEFLKRSLSLGGSINGV